jgi:hypothetical protein
MFALCRELAYNRAGLWKELEGRWLFHSLTSLESRYQSKD